VSVACSRDSGVDGLSERRIRTAGWRASSANCAAVSTTGAAGAAPSVGAASGRAALPSAGGAGAGCPAGSGCPSTGSGPGAAGPRAGGGGKFAGGAGWACTNEPNPSAHQQAPQPTKSRAEVNRLLTGRRITSEVVVSIASLVCELRSGWWSLH
jgi:hypothetical protein